MLWVDRILRHLPVTQSLDFTSSTTLGIGHNRVVMKAHLRSTRECVVAKFYEQKDRAEHMTKILQLLKDRRVEGVTEVIRVIETPFGTVVVFPFHQGTTLLPCHEPLRTLFTRKLVLLLNELKKHGVIHGDLRPTNFIFNEKTHELVLIDFDNACLASSPAVLHLNGAMVVGPCILNPEDFILDPPELLNTPSVSTKASFAMDAWGVGVMITLALNNIANPYKQSRKVGCDDLQLSLSSSLYLTLPSPTILFLVFQSVVPRNALRKSSKRRFQERVTARGITLFGRWSSTFSREDHQNEAQHKPCGNSNPRPRHSRSSWSETRTAPSKSLQTRLKGLSTTFQNLRT
jgi:serine/threonine protein kinase